jgi:cyclopropane fatty-acyl-phospholipid synthase-like methyltransferase
MNDTSSSNGQPNVMRPRQAADFEALYAGGPPPWDIGRPQKEFQALADAGLIRGRVLDVGCGTGEHALMAAGLGLEVTGIDLSATAIGVAERKAQERRLRARFAVGDVCDMGFLGEQFDTALDSGLFHVLTDEDRPRFVDSLGSVVRAGGVYHMLCFSEHEPGDLAPRRVTQDEIRASFADGWRVDSIEEARIEAAMGFANPRSWHATIVRL